MMILQAVLTDSSTLIRDFPILTASEIHQLQTWNQTQTDYPKEQTIVTLFEQQVEQTPNNIAVVFEGDELNYQQLNEKANQVAHYLLAYPTLKEISNPLIAICVERSLEMVIGLLGILKAGGAYVPIDPNYPAERIAHILNDSAVPLLLMHTQLQAQLLDTKSFVVCLDEIDWILQNTDNLILPYQPNDLAYVIYTSGSTGQPKGVMLEHRGAINMALSQQRYFYVNGNSRVLQFASFGFDASVSEILVTLLCGARLQLVKTDDIKNDLFAILEQYVITHVTLPPSILSVLSNQPLPNLACLVVAGETCPIELAQHWHQHCHFINAYGPTEASVCASVFEFMPDSQKLLIGSPIANIRLYVLDQQARPLPPDIPGELCISGDGLARGYLRRPSLTAEKFIEVELFGKRERIYKTGDLARWLLDGNLEYIGRIDNQVKLRGFRVELGEIEEVLTQHQWVREAVVMLYKDDHNKALAAYVTVAHEKSVIESHQLSIELRDYLKNRLPDYMLPASFTVLDKLPLTTHGKIDHQALPKPRFRHHIQFEVPRNEIEKKLAMIWQQILNQDEISIHDNFFSLGGDSILSIQIVALARQIGMVFTPRTLFEHQTIAELAGVVGSSVNIEAEQGLVMGEVPLTPIQQWFLTSDFPEYWHFNQSFFLKTSLDLSVDALQKAFAAVLRQHDALRLRYEFVEGGWQQRFVEMSERLPFAIEDLSAVTDIETALLQRTEYYQTSLNLVNGPLTRLVVFNFCDSMRIFWCIHHLVVDGVSWRILLEDLYHAYNQAVAGQTIRLPKKTSCFKTWAQRLSVYAQSETVQRELSYWQNLLVQLLPVDKPYGQNRLEYTKRYRIEWDAETTRALLNETTAAYQTDINDILLAALTITLQEWTGHIRCTIEVETHGRVELFKEIDLSRTVGWFTNIYPLSLTVPIEGDLGATIKTIQLQRQSIPNEGVGYGLLTYLGGKSLPKGDILFNYLGQFDQNIKKGDFSFASEMTYSPRSDKGERKHLIEVNGMISLGQLHFTWYFSKDCYHANTIETLANRYQRHLNSLIRHCQTQVRRQPKLETTLLLKKGNKPALFCIPGLGSKAGYFRVLAKQLQTTQTIYGLESPGLEGRYPIPETVEALAQQHIEIIRYFQPGGLPYYLLGHSFGAAVVLELAWQLELVGETVALVAIIDQPTLRCTPNISPSCTTEFDCLNRVVDTFQLLVGIELPFDFNQLKQTDNIQTACEKVMAWLKQHAMHELLFSHQGRTEELFAYIKVYQANETAFLNYPAANKKLRCAIDLFGTQGSLTAWMNLPKDWGWGAHTDEVRVHQISGTHFSVFNGNYAQDFAKLLDVQLHNTRQSDHKFNVTKESNPC